MRTQILKIQVIFLCLFINLQSFAQVEYCTYKPSESLIQDACKRFQTSPENIRFELLMKEDIIYEKISSEHTLIIEAMNIYEDVILYSKEEKWLLSILSATEEVYYKLYKKYCEKYSDPLPNFSCSPIPSTITYYEEPKNNYYEIFINNWEENNILYFILDENLTLIKKGKYPS